MRNGNELAEAGGLRALEHADAVDPNWSARARILLLGFAAARKAPFMINEAVRHAEASGLPPPPDRRAWGGVVRSMKRDGLLLPVGVGNSQNAAHHSGYVTLWLHA